MKQIYLIAAAILACLTGCAESLPSGTPQVASWTPVSGAAYYRLYYLPPTAPDRSAFLASTNWSRWGNDTGATNAMISAMPAKSVIAPCPFDGQGNTPEGFISKATVATNSAMVNANLGIPAVVKTQ